MKTKAALSLLTVGLLLCFMAVGCMNEPDEKGNIDISGLYTMICNEDNTYSYALADLRGNTLFCKENVIREPEINMVSGNVYELLTQTGTGLSTNWAVYCDVENGIVSETFYYVLGAKGDCVVCADYEEGKHYIIVQNIFDKAIYYKTYELENVSPAAADFALGCEFDGDNNVTITYLTGEDYKESKRTVDIP